MSKNVVVRFRRYMIVPTGTFVNVKLKHERIMRKHVRLYRHPSKQGVVLMRDGGSGRPFNVPLVQIERITKVGNRHN